MVAYPLATGNFENMSHFNVNFIFNPVVIFDGTLIQLT